MAALRDPFDELHPYGLLSLAPDWAVFQLSWRAQQQGSNAGICLPQAS